VSSPELFELGMRIILEFLLIVATTLWIAKQLEGED